ncbi:MAG: metallophosphoesterase [Bryobacteraceae bacterium]
MTRKSVLAIFILLGALTAQQRAPRVDFIHVTDTHVLDLKGVAAPLVKAREHFADGERRLAALLAGAGRPASASFALITGDLTDAFSFTAADGGVVRGQVEAFRRATAKSPIPVFLTLGNHDIQHYGLAPGGAKPAADQWLAGAARASWIRTARCFREGTYYHLVKQAGRTRYVFLVLDNGYAASGSPERPAVAMAHEQLYWLRASARANADAVLILAMHIPLGADATSQAIRQAVAAAPNVALVLAGHNHRDQIEDLDLGASRAVQVRTAALGYGTSNWRRIRLLEDGIEVYATGSRTQILRTVPLPAVARRPAA